MKRFAVVAAISLLSAGCRAPMPTWDSIGPYGTTRVPPPPTGGYGAQQPYYAPGPTTVPPTTAPTTIAPTTAPVGTGFRQSSSNRWSNIVDPAVGPVAQENSWAPTRPTQTIPQVVDLTNADVVLASHDTAAPFVPSTTVTEYDGPIRILASSPARQSDTLAATEAPRLRGMTLNDTTGTSEPLPFIPSGRVIDISQLPDAPNTLRTASGQSSVSASSSSSGQATVLEGGWKTRT